MPKLSFLTCSAILNKTQTPIMFTLKQKKEKKAANSGLLIHESQFFVCYSFQMDADTLSRLIQQLAKYVYILVSTHKIASWHSLAKNVLFVPSMAT